MRLTAERARHVANGVSKHGSVAYRDMIQEAISKGLCYVFIDFPLHEKSIKKLEELGYTIEGCQDGFFYKISW